MKDLQVHKALMDTATRDIVGMPNGHFGPLVHNRIVPIGTGELHAGLYPLHMELSSSGPRNSKPVINLGLHFPSRTPHHLTSTDIRITLERGVENIPSNITQVPGGIRGYIVSAKLPDKYLGKV